MTVRCLPQPEWPKLAGTELEAVWPHLQDLEGARILVVEDHDRIVGCWALFPIWSCEGVWIDEAHRGKAVIARKLMEAMHDLATLASAKALVTGCTSHHVRDILDRFQAVAIPPQFSFPVEALSCRLP